MSWPDIFMFRSKRVGGGVRVVEAGRWELEGEGEWEEIDIFVLVVIFMSKIITIIMSWQDILQIIILFRLLIFSLSYSFSHFFYHFSYLQSFYLLHDAHVLSLDSYPRP